MSLIFFLGIVSLFADITYEGARSIIGQYLFVLGSSSLFVGFIAGFGEFIGYFLRILFGYLADKTKNYWSFMIIGYSLNVFSVPLLAFTNNYLIAGILVLLERLGKAIRTPSRDTIISFIGAKYGSGISFGIHEFLDQIGALSGPLLIFLILSLSKNNYKLSFLILIIPAILCLIFLFWTKIKFSNISEIEIRGKRYESFKSSKKFWIYTIAIGFVSFGFIDFALISYHYKKINLFEPNIIAILYSIAMITDAISSIILGKLFDKFGIKVLLISILLTSFSSPLLFLFNEKMIIFLAIILWGIGIGSQESIMRAYISNIIKKEERATAFGIFNSIYGFSWFIGSLMIGYLYSLSLTYMVILSFSFQIFGLLILLKTML
ncbi:MAG: MFS transporter [Candidatus Hydrothermia bacterium]|nr:MFS transporter [Candidatus Hydrothermia bacterium]